MVSSLMLIVVERRETFHYYYPMGVHPPGDLTVTTFFPLTDFTRTIKDILLHMMQKRNCIKNIK